MKDDLKARYKATILDLDPTLDLALLKMEDPPADLQVMAFGDPDSVDIAQPVVAIADRITAVGDVIRKFLPNGLATSSGYTGAVRIPTTIAATVTTSAMPAIAVATARVKSSLCRIAHDRVSTASPSAAGAKTNSSTALIVRPSRPSSMPG